MANYVDLKPRRELLNPHFESYKLSLDALPTYSQELEKSLDVCTLTQDQLTLHHTKLFASPNHLTPDPWVDRSVYFVNTDWSVQNIFVQETGKIHGGFRVFGIPETSSYQQVKGRLSVSLCFPSQQYAVLADGASRLFLIDTGTRSHKPAPWKVLYRDTVLGESVCFTIVDAIQYKSAATTESDSGSAADIVECLLANVEVREGENKYPVYLTVLTWITFIKGQDGVWAVTRTRRLEGSRPFSYASIERGGGAVTVASNRPFGLTADSMKEVLPETENPKQEKVVQEPAPPLYTWSQGLEDISVQLTVPPGVSKADIYVSWARDHISVGVKNSVSLLSGPLPWGIDVLASTWTLEGQRLELTLTKEVEAMWETVVVGDNRGEMTFDEATVAAIHERLQHVTSDKWNPDPDPKNKPFNTQQLEACDAMDDEECTFLMRIDGETHKISHQATVNYSLLFVARLDAEKASSLCLRHDVDGLLWQPEVINPADGDSSKICPWQHVGTLNAFGYVQASKTQRRFSSCAADLSLAVIADCSRHVYLYRQRVPTGTPLRNRRTGQNISNVAKQHVVTLDPPDFIVGLHVSNDHVFVATASKIYAVSVSHDA